MCCTDSWTLANHVAMATNPSRNTQFIHMYNAAAPRAGFARAPSSLRSQEVNVMNKIKYWDIMFTGVNDRKCYINAVLSTRKGIQCDPPLLLIQYFYHKIFQVCPGLSARNWVPFVRLATSSDRRRFGAR